MVSTEENILFNEGLSEKMNPGSDAAWAQF